MHLWSQYRPSAQEGNEFDGFHYDLLMDLVQNCWSQNKAPATLKWFHLILSEQAHKAQNVQWPR